MKHTQRFLIAATLFAMTLAPCAFANSPFGNVARNMRNGRGATVRDAAVRNIRSSRTNVSRSAAGRNVGGNVAGALSRSERNPWNRTASSRGNRPRVNTTEIARGLSRMQQGSGNRLPSGIPGGINQNAMADALRSIGATHPGGYGHGSGHGYYPGRSHYREADSMARAYRDAAMVNAAVDLVGILVHASHNAGHRAVAPAPVAYAPAPVAYAPAGRWERQAVVLQPERREQHQEWVPETFDPRTGRKIGGGYYEIRTRVTPELVQYHDVWVTP